MLHELLWKIACLFDIFTASSMAAETPPIPDVGNELAGSLMSLDLVSKRQI